MKELVKIQSELKAPKGQFNKFGGYKYRSAEDILEAVKPLLAANECTLTLTDEVVQVGERYYIKAIATVTNAEGQSVTVSAFAREEDSKKGMDGAQITGSASSYARKYAMNGLFCIDDTKDPDATNTHGKDAKPSVTYEEVMALAERVTDKEEARKMCSNPEYKEFRQDLVNYFNEYFKNA